MFDSFPVCRTLFAHWIYDNPDYLKIWITMLGRARYSREPKIGMHQSVNYKIEYGQFIFGRIQWSVDLRLGEQKIRTCVEKMIADNMITLTRHTMKFTIYEIVNYAKYNHPDYLEIQGFQGEGQPTSNQRLTTHFELFPDPQVENNANFNHPDYLVLQGIQETTNQQITNRKPTDNQQITTKEEGSKKDKKVKKVILPKKTYGEKVHLTDDQYEKLVEKHGEPETNQMIEILDNWYCTKGKPPNNSDYHTMVGVGWVLKRLKEDQQKHGGSKDPVSKTPADKYDKFYL